MAAEAGSAGASPRLPLGGSSSRGYQYCVIQVVPDVARGERLNAGVVLLGRTADYLGMRAIVEGALWRAVASSLDVDAVSAQLAGLVAVAEGRPAGGVVATLTAAQRFHWITSPGSAVVQPGPVHTGLCPERDAAGFAGVLEALATRLLGRG